MTPGNETSRKRRIYEPPRLVRLSSPNDVFAACSSGSGNTSNCNNGNAAVVACLAGANPKTGECSAGTSGTPVCTSGGAAPT